MLNLVEHNDPILRKVCDEFDFNSPPFDPIEFSKDLVKFMHDSNAIGLAANQVGMGYRVFAMRGQPENFVCFNPRIVQYSNETVLLEEGCLSYPKLIVKVKRPQHIRCRFQTPNGETLTKQFTGMTARVFQHEFDHLNGIIYVDKLEFESRKEAFEVMEQLGWNKPRVSWLPGTDNLED